MATSSSSNVSTNTTASSASHESTTPAVRVHDCKMAISSRDAANDETTPDDQVKLSLLTAIGTEAMPSEKTLKELYVILDAQYDVHNEIQLSQLQLFKLHQGDKDLRAFYREGVLTTALAANTAKKAVQYSTDPEGKVFQAKRNSRSERCSSCGSEKHVEKYCHKRLICNKCGKKGHIRHECRESRKSERQRTQSEDSEDAKSVKYVEQRKPPETLWRAGTPETLRRGAYQIRCIAKEDPPTSTSATASDYEGSFECDSNLKDTIKEKIAKEVGKPENNVGNSGEVDPTHKRGDSNSAHQRSVINSDRVQQQVPKSTESSKSVDQKMNSASQEGLPRCDEQAEEADLESFHESDLQLVGA